MQGAEPQCAFHNSHKAPTGLTFRLLQSLLSEAVAREAAISYPLGRHPFLSRYNRAAAMQRVLVKGAIWVHGPEEQRVALPWFILQQNVNMSMQGSTALSDSPGVEHSTSAGPSKTDSLFYWIAQQQGPGHLRFRTLKRGCPPIIKGRVERGVDACQQDGHHQYPITDQWYCLHGGRRQPYKIAADSQ